MEYSAILHDMDKRFCYAIDKDLFVIRVQVKKDDIKEIILHYEDKYDLLNKLEGQLIKQLQERLQKNHALFDRSSVPRNDQYLLTNEAFNEVLSFIDQERALFKVLLSPNGDPHFSRRLRSLMGDEIIFRARLYHAYTTDQIPTRYVKEIMVGLLFDLINSWISNPHPESPETFAKILTASRLTAPMELLIIPQYSLCSSNCSTLTQTSDNSKHKLEIFGVSLFLLQLIRKRKPPFCHLLLA